MGALSLDLDLDLEAPLLAEVHDICQVACGVCRLAAAFVDGVGSGDLFRVIIGEPADTVSSAVLLVGGEREQEVFLQFHGVAEEDATRHELCGEKGLAVGRPATVDPAVGNGGAEGRVGPLRLVLDRHDIEVRHEHEAGSAGAPLQAGDDVAPARCRLDSLAVHSLRSQPVADVFADRGLVAGRHEPGVDGRDADKVLLQADDVVARGIDLGKQFIESRHLVGLLVRVRNTIQGATWT